jgi:hypothetical protein
MHDFLIWWLRGSAFTGILFIILVACASLDHAIPPAAYFGMAVGIAILSVVTGPLTGFVLRSWARKYQKWLAEA